MNLRVLHRSSALLIATFAVVHITNHLVALSGISAHMAFMETARSVYRHPLVEFVLLGCVSFQIASGLWLFFRGWSKRQGRIAWLQAISGAYLAFFLLVHVAAVLFGRSALKLDTNFYFAAAGLHVPPYQYFFGPYYFFAVLALFTHLGCAAYWRATKWPRTSRMLIFALPVFSGFVISMLIALSLGGALQQFEVPAKYKATYAQTGG